MKKVTTFGVAAGAWFTASLAAAAPLENYAQQPLVQSVAISGDGSLVAIGLNDGQKSSVLIRTVAGDGQPMVVNFGQPHIVNLSWDDAEHLAIFTDFRFITNGISSYAAPERHEFDLKTKKLDAPRPGRDDRVKRWMLDEDGHVLIQSNYIEPSEQWVVRWKDKVVASGKNPYGPPQLLAKGAGPDTYLMREPAEAGELIRELNVKTGEWSPNPQNSLGRSYFVDREGDIFGTRTRVGDEDRFEFKRKSDEIIWETLKRSFPNERIVPVSWSDDHKNVVLRLAGMATAPGFVLVDLNTKKATFIADEYGGVAKADVATIRPINYTAADGLEIHGYLTLPNGRSARGLPLVVLAHDGPQERDELDYSWWAQALASRGYAVLQSNFRGSVGYGESFAKAGLGEFGQKMQTDLSDGVRDLAKQGIIDPKRVCIAGELYGGYAALAGMTFEDGVYRCAVAVDAITDLPEFFTPGGRGARTAMARRWANIIGADTIKDKVLADRSPARHADRIDGPVLIVQGNNALTIGYDQGQRMAAALKKAGKTVETVHLEDLDKPITETNARVPMVQAMVTFLEKNNPPN